MAIAVGARQLSGHVLVDQERFAGVFDLGDGAFEVESFGEDYFENLVGVLEYWYGSWRVGEILYFLYVDTVACATEDQTCSHRLCETSSLGCLELVGDHDFEIACLTCVEISSCSSRGKLTK